MAKLTPRNSPKTPKTGKPGPEIPRALYIGRGKNGGTSRGLELSDYITHAMRCTRCTTAARLPGAKRCRPGAELRRDYLAALPEPVNDSARRCAAHPQGP